MSLSSFPQDHADVIDLQQQVARLQALLEVSWQVHAAVRPEEVLQSVLRIVVRELEMVGAHVTEPSLTVGEMFLEGLVLQAGSRSRTRRKMPLTAVEGSAVLYFALGCVRS
jgi:hypothetical protein